MFVLQAVILNVCMAGLYTPYLFTLSARRLNLQDGRGRRSALWGLLPWVFVFPLLRGAVILKRRNVSFATDWYGYRLSRNFPWPQFPELSPKGLKDPIDGALPLGASLMVGLLLRSVLFAALSLLVVVPFPWSLLSLTNISLVAAPIQTLLFAADGGDQKSEARRRNYLVLSLKFLGGLLMLSWLAIRLMPQGWYDSMLSLIMACT